MVHILDFHHKTSCNIIKEFIDLYLYDVDAATYLKVLLRF